MKRNTSLTELGVLCVPLAGWCRFYFTQRRAMKHRSDIGSTPNIDIEGRSIEVIFGCGIVDMLTICHSSL